jgi:hypothetical protein
MLNANIPYFKCKIKRSYFTKNAADSSYDEAYAVGVQSVAGKILTFHVMTDYGMFRSRVPLSEIYIKEPTSDLPYYFKQLWDCFSNDVTVITYGFLETKRCQVILKDGSKIWATYMFTIDWQNNPYSNEPTDYKCGHVLVADDGYLLCQPNNRILWKDSNWVTKEFDAIRDMKVDTELLSVESVSDRWITEDGNSFYYEIKDKNNNTYTTSNYNTNIT